MNTNEPRIRQLIQPSTFTTAECIVYAVQYKSSRKVNLFQLITSKKSASTWKQDKEEDTGYLLPLLHAFTVTLNIVSHTHIATSTITPIQKEALLIPIPRYNIMF